MTNAKRDQNSVPAILGVLNTDGVTITPVKIDPSTHKLAVSDGISGSNHGTTNVKRDQNYRTALMAVSTDGVTPVALYVTSAGELLLKST